MGFCSLPLELVTNVIYHYVLTVGVARAFRARLVCKAFNAEIVRASFSSDLDFRDDRMFVSELVPKRMVVMLLKHRLNTCPQSENCLLVCLRRMVSLFTADQKNYKERNQVLHDICTAVVDNLGSRHAYSALGGYELWDPAEEVLSSLTLAAYFGNLSWVQYYLNSGADVNGQSKYFGRPLRAAARKGHLPAMRLLLEHKADPERAEYHTSISLSVVTALEAACSAGHEEAVLLLAPACAKPRKSYEKAILHAAEQCHPDTIQHLLALSISLNERIVEQVLRVASLNGNDAVVKWALYEIRLNDADVVFLEKPNQPSALALAVSRGHLSTIQVIIDNIDWHHMVEEWAISPKLFGHAARYGQVRAAELLTSRGLSVTNTKPLSIAVQHGQVEMVRFLLANGPLPGSKFGRLRPKNSELAISAEILTSAARYGYESIISLLVEYGVDVNGGGDHSPMLEALRYGHDHVKDLLLTLGARRIERMNPRDKADFQNGFYPRRTPAHCCRGFIC